MWKLSVRESLLYIDTRIHIDIYVVVCTDFLDKQPYRQVVVDRMMASGSLGSVIGIHSSLCSSVASNPAVGAIFAIFIIPNDENIDIYVRYVNYIDI